jgi:8-amino-7-oxononanoate synthase
MTLEDRIRRSLAGLDAQGLRRRLRPPEGIDLCSNDYLGLAAHPLIRERMARAVLQGGAGSTGSRLLRGEREAFQRVEQRFAKFKNAERALYFSSGYLANLGVLSTFAQAGDVIFSDALNHASLIDGARLSRARRVIYPHGDLDTLAKLLGEEAGQKFVVTESLFSMDGDFAPLAAYAQLCRETGAALIVDEAHATGIYGERGSGCIEQLGADDGVFLSINTAGKALGVAGAFVCGPEWAIEYLVQRARPFIFSTAAPPAVAAAIDAALDVIQNEPERRERLKVLTARLRTRLGLGAGSQIVPLILGENERALAAAEALQKEGFDVRAIRPPTVPAGTARLRISINAGLTEHQLDRFAEVLQSAVGGSICVASS